MKHTTGQHVRAALAAALTTLFAFASLQAEKITFLPVESNQTRVSLEGTSNVRDWDAQSNRIEGSIKIDAPGFWGDSGFVPGALPTSADEGIEVTVRIASGRLESSSRRLTSNLQGYLDARSHPYIVFQLESIELAETGEAQSDDEVASFTTNAEGMLTVSGDTKRISFPVEWSRNRNLLIVSGKAELKMSEFGIDPPTMMLGALRTVDDFTVEFNWVLRPE